MNNRNDLHIEVLREILSELIRARHWLVRSWEKCKLIHFDRQISDEEYDALEAYTSRFSRASDLLIQKVFRAIDSVELEKSGTLLDAVNRAVKRGIVHDEHELRIIRETRNEISHEYISEEIVGIYDQITEYTPKLLLIIDHAIDYCRKYTDS